MTQTNTALGVYYFLIAYTGVATIAQIRIWRWSRAQRDALYLELLLHKVSLGVVLLADQRVTAETCRFFQHLVLFLILVLILPIGWLRLFEQTHYWLTFAAYAGGIAAIPTLLLYTSLTAIQTNKKVRQVPPPLVITKAEDTPEL